MVGAQVMKGLNDLIVDYPEQENEIKTVVCIDPQN